jgi:hypothetical protein
MPFSAPLEMGLVVYQVKVDMPHIKLIDVFWV